MKKVPGCTLVALAFVLLFSGCAGTVKESAPPGQTGASPGPSSAELSEQSSPQPSESAAPTGTVAIAASFQREDGTPLVHETIRISDGDNSMDYPLDSSGALRLSGLPNSGALSLSILDQQGQEAVTMSLVFATGAVIDAMTDGDGVGHISLKENTDEVALDFTWNDDGSLICSLRLSKQ